ncbi:adenosylcobinamide-phosphate synthase CbiB [Pseudobutyrivibrio sp.]|uniref:adenosylcobinamide-phosphate synthase CbiB n=1 Tax=Pseudobutyrivibrio sp. TaxID=2014367 RepID=UPI0025D48652|nr:adenosylcobinamide-phosphate synthase CbiB [Pseudobutyrivibrio sp.]
MGYVLDLLLGDPFGSFHPVVWIGKLISVLTGKLLKENDSSARKRLKGRIIVIIVIAISVLATGFCVILAYNINSILGIAVEAIITYQCLATKSLYTESMKVYYALKDTSLEAGRTAVSMIVGRDTATLDEAGVTKAAVETVAENTSDGVIAPLIYLAIGGPVLGICYKTINTMDSMIGYKNDKYMDFGRAAAKLDDVVNFVPARISAVLMIIATLFLGKKYNTVNAIYIFKRDRFNHPSPNSAQTESVCAGALGIQLAGPASYFGKLKEKPYIGDMLRKIEVEDIKRANLLMTCTSILCASICGILILAIEGRF